MKVLRILFILFLLLLGLMIYLSERNKEVIIETKTTINAPVSECFMTFIDPTKMIHWMPDFQRMEFVSGFPSQVGSKYILHFKINDHDVVMDETITTFEFNKRFAATLSNPMMESKIEILFNDLDGKTEVISKQVTKPTGFLNRVFTGLIKGDIIERDRQTYSNLKALIEN